MNQKTLNIITSVMNGLNDKNEKKEIFDKDINITADHIATETHLDEC
jgi:hypothetical protein